MPRIPQLFLILAVALLTALLFGKRGAWKKIAVVALLAYPVALGANLLTYWWVFTRVEVALKNAGWGASPYLLNASTAILAFLLYALIPVIVAAFVKSHNWKLVAISTAVYSAMNILLFTISIPRPEQVVNLNNGKPLYKFYRDTENNCVDRFPANYEYHPGHVGVKLQEPDDKIVQEWKKHPCKPDTSAEEERKKIHELEKENQRLRELSTKTPQAKAQATAPTNSNETAVVGLPVKHENWFNNVQLSFDSCLRIDQKIACAIYATSYQNEDLFFGWNSDIFATDDEGNTHSASAWDVGGSWPTTTKSTGWFSSTTTQDPDFNDTLHPHVKKKLRLEFSGVFQAVRTFQDLRFSVYHDTKFLFILRETQTLVFTMLPITQSVQPKFEKVEAERPRTTDSVAAKPEVRLCLDSASEKVFLLSQVGRQGCSKDLRLNSCKWDSGNINCSFELENNFKIAALLWPQGSYQPLFTTELIDDFGNLLTQATCVVEGFNNLAGYSIRINPDNRGNACVFPHYLVGPGSYSVTTTFKATNREASSLNTLGISWLTDEKKHNKRVFQNIPLEKYGEREAVPTTLASIPVIKTRTYTYQDGPFAGFFQELSQKRWQEKAYNGLSYFTEEDRDSKWIYLRDSTRRGFTGMPGMNIRLPLNGGQSSFQWGPLNPNGQWTDLYIVEPKEETNQEEY